jgi:hypothetical protein
LQEARLLQGRWATLERGLLLRSHTKEAGVKTGGLLRLAM